MHAPGDRLEVVDVERVRPQVAVPADDVERMMAVEVAGHPAARLDADLERAPLVVRLQHVRRPDVALAVGSALDELAVTVAVAGRRLQVPAGGLDDEHPLVAPAIREDAPEDAGGDDQVVVRAVAQRSELAVQDPLAVVNEDQLVAVRIAVPVVHRLHRSHDRDAQVRVGQQRHPAPDGVAGRPDARRPYQPVPQRALWLVAQLVPVGGEDAFDLGRRPDVIEERLDAGEAMDAHHLLVVQGAVGLPELRVALVRHLAAPDVVAHDAAASTRLPRRACSRSIASKSDWKFPWPKPLDPRRSITSKNTVGRSWTGSVKICSR